MQDLHSGVVFEESCVLEVEIGLRVNFIAAKNADKVSSKEKQALVDMARADMDAYKELNRQLPDPLPGNKVRGPKAHPSRGPHSQQPHGHVGSVGHVPITGAN